MFQVDRERHYGMQQTATQFGCNGVAIVHLNGSTDYLEIYGFNSNAVTTVATNASTLVTYFHGIWVGP